MILYLTNAPSEILALRSLVEGLPDAFPDIRAADPSVAPGLDGVEVVMVRLLGGASAWPGLEALRRQAALKGVPLLAFGGEAAPDAEMTAASTVPSATVAQAFEYLVHGGLENLEQMLRFVSDTVCMTGFGFDPPTPVPTTGLLYASPDGDGPLVAILFYRAHLIAGNTIFVEDLCRAMGRNGGGQAAAAVWAYLIAARARTATGSKPSGSAGGAAPGRSDHHRAGVGLIRGGRVGMGRLGHWLSRCAGPAGGDIHGAQVRLGGGSRRAGPGRRGHAGGHPGVRRTHHLGALFLQ